MRIHSISSLVLVSIAVLLAVSSTVLAVGEQVPPQEKQFADWIHVLEPHLHATGFDGGDPYAIGPQPFDWRHHSQFIVTLDNTGAPANPYKIPGGAALSTAALYYAIYTGDFNVSPGDLEHGGWWPFATIPADMDRSLIVQGEQNGGVLQDTYQLLKHIGSPQWMMRAKGDVLNAFYGDFFFRRPVKKLDPSTFQPPQPSDAEHEWWSIDYEAPWTAKTPADLPARNEEFWTNPYTSAPMRVSDEPGDLQWTNAGWLSQWAAQVEPSGKVQTHNGSGSYDPKLKLEVLLPNWKQFPPQPWSARCGAQLAATPVWLTSGTDSAAMKQHLDSLLAHYTKNEIGRTKELQLDATAERAPIEELVCPQALALAAYYYALATADTQVSLRDIVDSGFWPYDTFPTWLDLTETLYDFNRYEDIGLGYGPGAVMNGVPQPAQWYGQLSTDLGTPQWLLWRKAEILNQVHAELFFNPRAEYVPKQGIDPESEDLLPKFAAFWVNPVASAAAGKPVAFTYGPVLGQLSALDVNLLRPLYEGAHIRYAQQVPLINLADKMQHAAGGQPNYVYRQRSVEGVTEMGRAWQVPASAGGGLAELRWRFSDPAGLQENVLLDTGWDTPAPMPGADAKPMRAPYRYGVRTYQYGEDVNDGITSFWQKDNPAPQLVYDGVAPLVKRYGLTFSQQPRDYTFIVQMIRIRSGGVQLPGGKAGIDPLVEPMVLELASN